ncbi:hypothetical protein BGX33_005699 [Mortierella sp. NVP41]|nr:hypothetical protein BGX33_005699 [Mortierella sp. NVP41]
MERMSSDLTVHCPRLKKVCFLCSDPDKIAELLSDAFVRLEHCTFDYNAFNKVTLLGLLEHQETLTTVILSHNHPEIEPNSPDKNPAAKKLIALLLRSCRRLEELSIEGHRMNVVTLENQDWICENLRDLRVRFHGLETEAAVDYCLEQLMARKKGEVANAIDNGGGDSIFDRICLQLFRFKKLKTIWLGTGEYYLATQ